MICKVVRWTPPDYGLFKYNTNGASRGNLSDSSYAFTIRNKDGDLIYAKDEVIPDTTSVQNEEPFYRE